MLGRPTRGAQQAAVDHQRQVSEVPFVREREI